MEMTFFRSLGSKSTLQTQRQRTVHTPTRDSGGGRTSNSTVDVGHTQLLQSRRSSGFRCTQLRGQDGHSTAPRHGWQTTGEVHLIRELLWHVAHTTSIEAMLLHFKLDTGTGSGFGEALLSIAKFRHGDVLWVVFTVDVNPAGRILDVCGTM